MRYINYLLILLGGIISIYAKTSPNEDQYILIGGIVLLMIGIYRISKTIPSRSEEDNHLGNNEN
ncbi:hypothetical protein QLS71_017805 [Mariniflexile litorale]|uniref:Uncharacterized protein n=1 Tax=Mariniflexile litorale TaxID=3045158 RepID=A0AAU7EDB7_9FLAO|nr:hypothetical protein [Mariniflexile sp. KMM 9835]MDQ8213123.1 hypothetical protein [Mariniflexile sp. KMM 9835]